MPAPELRLDDVLTLIAARADELVRLTDISGDPKRTELVTIAAAGRRIAELCQYLVEITSAPTTGKS